jgi:cysteine-rich repeat protein
MRRMGLLGGVAVLALGVGSVGAQPIALTGGTTARFTDAADNSKDKATIVFRRDPQLVTLQDPRCPAVSSLRLNADAQDTGEITLPCANWRLIGSGFQYKDTTAAAGGVQKITYKSGVLNIRMKGSAYAALHGVVNHIEVRFRVGAARHCGRFQSFKRNTTERIAAAGPTLACQPLCGDGLVDPGEQCDDGNKLSGDCCSSTCQFEHHACDDGNLCTENDACNNGVCAGTTVRPWVNELDYDDFTGVLDDRDEFVEIAAPAGTDLGGYKLLAIEGNLNGNTQAQGAPCYSDLETGITTGNPYWTAVIPPGTVVADDTGTGIGFLVVCFTNTSTNRLDAGECDVVLPAPSTTSNLKNGYLLNVNQTDCPDGLLVLDPFDNLIDAIGYEGQLPNMGLYGSFFQTPSYTAGTDQGWVAGVSLEKRSSNLRRALNGAEWSLSGGCTFASPAEDPQETTLASAIGAGDTSVTLASAQPAPPFYPVLPMAGTVQIGAEQLQYTGRSDVTLTGVTRGANGTAPAAHAANAVVSLVTGCRRHSSSPGATNPGQLLSCIPGTCGNGAIDAAAGERCDPNAVPNGCPSGRWCISAGEPLECTCLELCGNGTIDPGEDCEPLGNACPGGIPCNADCTCPPPPTCAPVAYETALSGLDLCTAFVAACPPPVQVPLTPPSARSTYAICFTSPDSAGRIGLSIDPETYFNDAGFTPAGPASPIALTQRFCQSAIGTGTLFTTAAPSSFPAKRCLVGDPDRRLQLCARNSDCDGPSPVSGNGICASRDVDYTSVTTSAGTTVAVGDGVPDPAGALLLAHPLDVQVFLGNDVRCSGDGTNPNCVRCDGNTPAPAGRIGVLKAAMPPALVLPLNILWSTASVKNKVMQSGNFLDGREVTGAGAIHDVTAGGSYELAAANAALNITGPLTVHIQFQTIELRAPLP